MVYARNVVEKNEDFIPLAGKKGINMEFEKAVKDIINYHIILHGKDMKDYAIVNHCIKELRVDKMMIEDEVEKQLHELKKDKEL